MDGILIENPPQATPLAPREGHGPSLLTMIGFVFLTLNSAVALYKSNGDAVTIAFVTFAYLDLVLLFYSWRISEGAGPPNSCRRWAVKASVWTLTTLLTVMFGYKVAAVMPLPMAVVVLAMAAAGMLGVFYGFCAPPRESTPRRVIQV